MVFCPSIDGLGRFMMVVKSHFLKWELD